MCLWADLIEFSKIFSKAKNIAIITGAGVSAESGVPTFRGAGGYWRKWQAQVCNHSITLLSCIIWRTDGGLNLGLVFIELIQPSLSITVETEHSNF